MLSDRLVAWYGQSTLRLQTSLVRVPVNDIDLLVNISFVLEALDEAVFDFNETIVLDDEASHCWGLVGSQVCVPCSSLIHQCAVLRDSWPCMLGVIQLQHGH